MALHFIGGIMEHARALCAVTNPDGQQLQTTRPQDSKHQPTSAWSMRNRSPMIRIPDRRGLGTRMELRMPDPSLQPVPRTRPLLSVPGSTGSATKRCHRHP